MVASTTKVTPSIHSCGTAGCAALMNWGSSAIKNTMLFGLSAVTINALPNSFVGDEAGSIGGIISSKTKGKAEFVNFSFDVKAEGKNVPRAMDLMLHNDKNTPPVPLLQGPVILVPGSEKIECLICGEGM